MYKAIITDLDGTLFNGESLISDYSAEALRQAEEASSALLGKMTGGLGGGFPF